MAKTNKTTTLDALYNAVLDARRRFAEDDAPDEILVAPDEILVAGAEPLGDWSNA